MAPIVMEIFTRFGQGERIKDIIQSLTERGIKNRNGNDFKASNVGALLKNRKYIGEYKYGDVVIPNGIPKIIDEDLSSYTTLFESIISKIKLKDASFDPSDYKVTYHLANAENGYGDIYFTYYIDGKIETNKVYIATFENYKITDIVLGGVTIDNLDNVKTNVKTLLNNKISLFENEKVSKLLEKDSNLFKKSKLQTNQVDVLDVNKKIKISSLNGNVIESSELYYYDYNTQELKYILKTVKNINGLYDADGIEIII